MSRELSLEELIDALKKGNDFQNIECDWSELDGSDWSLLLSKHPQFADKCDWKKLGGTSWSSLLEHQPQFADKCNKWNEFDSEDWRVLLSEQPQFADKCDWKKLKGDDWQKLLEAQPQFADKYKLYQILFLKQEGDSIVVYCKGERKFDWDLYDGGALITAIDDLRKIIETLPPDDGAKLLEQGIGLTFEAPELASVIEKELAIKTYIIEFEKDNFNEDFELDNDLDDEIGCEQQESAVEFDEKGKYYLYRDNFARENQRTFDTISEAYKYLCQDADGACIFFCDGYGESQEPPSLDWLKKVINSCGKVEVEIGFSEGAKDIWIYQKER